MSNNDFEIKEMMLLKSVDTGEIIELTSVNPSTRGWNYRLMNSDIFREISYDEVRAAYVHIAELEGLEKGDVVYSSVMNNTGKVRTMMTFRITDVMGGYEYDRYYIRYPHSYDSLPVNVHGVPIYMGTPLPIVFRDAARYKRFLEDIEDPCVDIFDIWTNDVR